MSIYYTETYKEVIENNSIENYSSKHGEDIHINGTHELIGYVIDQEEECLFLTLDFDNDYKTPVFYVTGFDGEIFESHDTFEKAFLKLKQLLKNKGVIL